MHSGVNGNFWWNPNPIDFLSVDHVHHMKVDLSLKENFVLLIIKQDLKSGR